MRYFLIIGLTCVTQALYAQQNFKSGVVINNKLDTIHGDIDYKGWSSNPSKITFRQNQRVNSLSIEDIIYFEVNNEHYTKAIVDIEVSPAHPGLNDKSPEFEFKRDTVFLISLIEGEKSLYQLRPQKGKDNFYTKDSTGTFILLRHKKYYKATPQKNIIAENNAFIGQLGDYLGECSSLYKNILDVKYQKESLMSVFDYYDNCSGSLTYYKKQKEKVRFNKGLIAGVSENTLKFTSSKSTWDYLTKAEFNYSATPTLGLFAEIIFPRNNKSWSMYNEIIYTSFDIGGAYEQTVSQPYETTKTNLGMSYVKMVNTIRYSYNLSKISFFGNAGISNGVGFNEKNSKTVITHYSLHDLVQKNNALNNIQKYERCLLIGLGAKLNRFSGELRYENGGGLSKYVDLGSRMYHYYLLVVFSF